MNIYNADILFVFHELLFVFAVGQGLVSAAEDIICFGMMKWGVRCFLSCLWEKVTVLLLLYLKNGLSISNGLKGGGFIVFMVVCVCVWERERERERDAERGQDRKFVV